MKMGDKSVSFADGIEGRVDPQILKRLAESGPDVIFEDIDDDDLSMKKKKEEGEEENVRNKKHTLDSDEEDEEDHRKMDTRKIDGQEDCTLDFDGQIKITAFNMKEDEEDGHFDESGNFIFEKKEEIKDAWLDGIDWGNVKKKAGDHWEKTEENEDDEGIPVIFGDDRRKEIFRKLVELLSPGQTVAKALAELRKKRVVSAAEERKQRWAAKKAGTTYVADDGQHKTTELSGLADELVSAGHMDAYEWGREKVEFLLGKLENVAVDVCNMFSDEPAVPNASCSNATAEVAAFMDETVTWEYKENEDGEIQGPFSSEVMAKRQADGKLESKSLARKTGRGAFNPALRIDFDLYC